MTLRLSVRKGPKNRSEWKKEASLDLARSTMMVAYREWLAARLAADGTRMTSMLGGWLEV
ncbi:1172_t:CDS:2 [Acaulospora colombiana]|uniref:1172_t:CDS:1 n=1 Tax=Acaulospora colombiana TaxID=27376 RepID=A0ACA9PH63_9GLOM|nr:1172_t:CDS:2 [Acaulospora colombiana]